MHRTTAELEDHLPQLLLSPREEGTVELVVRRPGPGLREVLTSGELDPAVGLVGDTWDQRPSSSSPDGGPHPDKQLTLMNHRVALFVAGDRAERVPEAGDQIYVDLDLSVDHLPPGTLLAVGTAVVEVTAPPHTGCKKFLARFGEDALRFVSSRTGRALRLRGANARVVEGGVVRPGDTVRRLPTPQDVIPSGGLDDQLV